MHKDQVNWGLRINFSKSSFSGLVSLKVVFCGFILWLWEAADLELSCLGEITVLTIWDLTYKGHHHLLYLPSMKIFSYFYMPLVILEKRVKQHRTVKLTHHASQLVECTESSTSPAPPRKVLEWHTWTYCKPEKCHFVALPKGRIVSINRRFLGYKSFSSVF